MSARICRHPLRIVPHAPAWLACDTCRADFPHSQDCPGIGTVGCVTACMNDPKPKENPMATFSYRDIVTRTREYTVPADAKWGAFLGDMQAAIAAARIAFTEANPGMTVADDSLRFFARDDEIVISFTIEESA